MLEKDKSSERPLYIWRFESSIIPCTLIMFAHEWFNDTVAVPNPNSAKLLDRWRRRSIDRGREDPGSFTVAEYCISFYIYWADI